MGSGAFLVQACRWLADRLVEAWAQVRGSRAKPSSVDGEVLEDMPTPSRGLPRDTEARTIVARRLIAERCLYGVDLNPLAVELAKLSIWLVTLAKGRPFGFLDHNLRCGDSLLGIHRLDQLTQLSMNPTGQGQLRLFGQNIEQAVREAIELRQRLREMPIRDIRDVEAMAHLDADARRRLAVPERIADAFIGEVFASGGSGAALENALVSLTVQAGQAIEGGRDVLSSMRRRSIAALSTDLSADKPARRPFHWPLEFPEVFARSNAGFDAFVGNPPFLGGKRIGQVLGDAYNAFLKKITAESKGAADLSAYFFRRTFELLRNDGCSGLLATNSISQADTREVGLDPIANRGGAVYAATTLVVWPGTANVHASIVHIIKGKWLGDSHLDGQAVSIISTRLSKDSGIADKPYRLKSVFPKASGGTGLLGIGFVVDVSTHDKWLRSDSKYRDILWPYINGKELNAMSRPRPPRYVINFENRSESEAEQYPLAMDRVRELVKPQRDVLTKQIHESCYWKHWDKRAALYDSIKEMHRVLVCSFVSKHLPFTFLPVGWVYSKELVVIPSDSAKDFAILQSSIHGIWVRHYSGTLKSDLSYSISDGLRTFPEPSGGERYLEECGEDYWGKRQAAIESLGTGLTDIYNKIHDSSNAEAKIADLRELHRRIDLAVAHAYGWDDLDLEHGFHEVPYLPENDRVRFTISETARVEVLRRLSDLNRQRYEEEVAQGLHGNTTPRASDTKRRRASADVPQPALDFDAIPANAGQYLQVAEPRAEYRVGPAHAIVEYLSTHPGWHAKADILAATGITDGQWNTAIADLIAGGKVERQGERRGARYRAKP
jgi:hypothetical protein